MSNDRLLERCAIEFERFVIGLHDSRPDRDGLAETCVPWSRHGIKFNQSEIPYLISETRKVLLARAQFAATGPAWAQPLPVGDEITPLLKATGAMYLLGAYSCSLMMLGYDFQVHPSFYDYGCGVMNHPRAPEHVRSDLALRKEFPAKELPGLCGRLVWFGENLPRLTGT